MTFCDVTRIRAAALTYAALALPVARASMEASMTLHMLVQIPLLAATGFLAAQALPQRWRQRLLALAGGPWPLLLAVSLASSWWMLPRALDATLFDARAEAAKFISLPLLVGLPLAVAWERLGLIGRGFVWTNFISMLVVVGWLYLEAPVRVCNAYLLMEQEVVGRWMVKLAIAMLLGWLATLFVADRAGTRASTNDYGVGRWTH